MDVRNKEEERPAKPSKNEIFGVSGPLHLTCVDWRIPDHRRSVAASLVQGVYILERDRQQKRIGNQALAPLWWEYFHFQCIQILVDQVDSSIFGAIFEHKPHNNPNYYFPISPQSVPPKHVIAFRGTLTEPKTRNRDLYLDMQLMLNGLTRNTRYRIAFQAVDNLIMRVGYENVWLTGHSLGAAIALQVGKEIAKRKCYTETYLFNPPFASAAPIEKLNNSGLKSGARIATSVVTAGLSLALNTGNKYITTQPYDPFTMISPWIPYLFVNPNDPISCEYIGYFEHREKMDGWGVGDIEKIATKNSVIGLLSGALGRDSDALHLIPSAFVVKNMIAKDQDIRFAHGVHQWWEPHSYWHQKLYQW